MQNQTDILWEDLGITRQFISAVQDIGFAHPTEIQAKCIPILQGGQNLVGIAQTGTGKTGAYLIPILFKLKYFSVTGPRALVLLPTKELAVQVAQQAQLFAKNTDIRIVALFGGVGPKAQEESLKAGCDLIISTPGRFEELYLKGSIVTKTIKILVVDEADRMMDMNFMPQLRRILEWIPSRRQNLLFSATFPEKVERMAREFIDFATRVEITPQSTPSTLVEQMLYRVSNIKTKLNLLKYFLTKEEFKRVIIFARKKQTVSDLGKFLERMELGSVRTIHSNKSQNARMNAIREFGEGDVRILVSTDVAARGIDIKKVSHVINFDVPMVYEDYVHRVGRTGRAFETGVAITFVTPSDEYHIERIEAIIREKIESRNLPEKVFVEETPFYESQQIAREIDRQKRLVDPTYRGAFHERKK